MILVITLCSTLACEQHRVPMPGASAMTCLVAAQAEASRYVRDGLRVERMACEAERRT